VALDQRQGGLGIELLFEDQQSPCNIDCWAKELGRAVVERAESRLRTPG
jgi:hypothetical protein